jgi:hypothetical protein
MLKINSTALVQNWIENYNTWLAHEKFYNQRNHLSIVHSNDGIPCYLHNDVAGINRSTSAVIVIDCLIESIHSINTFVKYNPDKHYIIFCNGWWDQSKISLPYSYTLIHHFFYLFEMADTYLSPNRFCFYLDKEYRFEDTKPCEFVCMMGSKRPERNVLIDTLAQTINYKNYILRYSGEDLGLPCETDIVLQDPDKFNSYLPLVEKYYHDMSQSLPINMYNMGRFGLVVESDLTLQHQFTLTEKTIKVLITGLPFVLAGTPYFLKHLRELGFITYNSLWDESYDEIEDFEKRMIAVAKLCNQLADFEWAEHRKELEQIKLLNRNNFLNLNQLVNLKFTEAEKKLIKVLDEIS